MINFRVIKHVVQNLQNNVLLDKMKMSASKSDSQQALTELTLVDYFVVAGYEKDTVLKAEINADPSIPPLERSYVATILHHFPKKRAAYSFPSEILPLCLPKGLRFCTQNDVPPPTMHTFANMREDGSRINGCAMIFYEVVNDAHLCEQMSFLHTEHVRALTVRDKTDERVHVPPGTVSGGTHTLPRGHRKERSKRTSYYDPGDSQLYVSKCLCLINRIPFVLAGEQLLSALHSIVTSRSISELPLESYIYWMLNEVPLPAPGSTVKVCLHKVDIVLQRPGPNELPFFDYSLSSMFDLLSVDKFLRLFTCFLLEHQILLCSRSLQRLMLVAESLCSLAFPFRWQLTYVPILPYSQLKFMEAPVPFVMGLCYEDVISDAVFQGNMCVLDIDSGEFNMPEDVPTFPDRLEFAREVANLLVKFDDKSVGVNSENVKRRIGGSAISNRDEWIRKRLSRSFDDDSLKNMLEDENCSQKIISRNDLAPLPLDDILKQSEVLARVTAIARRAGVNVHLENIEKELQFSDSYNNSPVCRKYFMNMKVNNSVREVFLNRFAWLLYSYEHFVIGGACKDLQSYFASRESVVNFDKAAFLSDQPNSNLPFLAAFLETQMFASFIDVKIMSQWGPADDNLLIFDARIQALRIKYSLQMVRTPTYETALPSMASEEAILKREEALDYIVPMPHEILGIPAQVYEGIFPELNEGILEGTSMHSPMPSPWKQRHRRLRPKTRETAVDRNSSGNSYGPDSPKQIAHQNWKFVEQLLKETKSKTKRMLVEKMGKEALQIGYSDAAVNGLEENTLVALFCDLLERIWTHGLIKKQGKSSLWAHILHHQEVEKLGMLARSNATRSSSVTPNYEQPAAAVQQKLEDGVAKIDRTFLNEITQSIRSECSDPAAPAWSLPILRAANFICDKISVGSTLDYLADSQPTAASVRLGRSRSSFKSVRNTILHKANSFGDLSPYWSANNVMHETSAPNSPQKRSASRTQSPDARQAPLPLPTQIAYDLKNVLRMTDIKTDIGYARAFVRLALERKLLHKHLKTVLSNSKLLQILVTKKNFSQMYKRYAFLRCDDEKEQFLYHILSLNAADFYCFTNTFKKTRIQYRVLLFLGNSRSTVSLPIWIIITGSLCSTTSIEIQQGIIDFKFDHKNLGMLSTLRIGFNDAKMHSGMLQKWFLDFVLVRNDITGQNYRFNCGRWFGRGVDDGSLERLLVAEKLPQFDPSDACTEEGEIEFPYKSYSRSHTPPRSRSPSTTRVDVSTKSAKIRVLTEIQQQLGEAVNAIVKYFYSNTRSNSELTQLLCAPEKGFVCVMVAAFNYGRQDSIWSSRLFKQNFPWDYVEKVCYWFQDLMHMDDAKRLSREQRSLISQTCRIVRRILSNTFLGKDGKFQLFVLITLREHILSGLLPLMAGTPISTQMYSELSFIRTPQYLNYLSKLIGSLNEFQFVLEKSLTYGID